MSELGTTPSQTVGPFLSIGLPWADGADAAADGTPGAVVVEGIVRDGAGIAVPDALLETWQADRDGRFPSDDGAPFVGFRHFARAATDVDGRYWFRTLVPGPVDGQAPHIDVIVFARGLLKHLVTRIYFPQFGDANAADPVLSSLPPDDRSLLVAVADGADHYRFDIRLQGEGETPFFEV